MARTAADALAVVALARIAGCVEGDAVPLDVAPLFETVADLEAAPSVMRALFDDPVYRAHLRTRGDRQTVMLGYSDSAKDRSEEHTSELQSLMRISYAVFCLKKKNNNNT